MDPGESLDVSQNSGKVEASSRRCTSRSIAARVTPSLARVNFLAGNQGQSLGFCLTTEHTENTEKEGSGFRVFGVFGG